nr:dTDP-4-dehydrorhamnose 3,5-epimerase family protein [Dehalococcoidales bacterium]
MQITATKLPDVWLIKPDVDYDYRGEYAMIYNEEWFKKNFPQVPDFLEEDISYSSYGVLRGLHYSPHCWKLNEVLFGKLYYVVVNVDKNHKDYRQWESFILSGENHFQLLKHPRYASGFLTQSNIAIFHYWQSQYYDTKDPDQQTFKFNDREFGIWWPPTKKPILSQRDSI